MPFSDADGKNEIRRWIKDLNPRFVLDIGPGSGVYGEMVRDVANPNQFYAIEVYAPYISTFNLERFYDEVIVSDVRHVDSELISNFDVVIIGDVIEHMHWHEAREVLTKLFMRNRNVIISFPVLHLPQESWDGNTFEKHVDHWSVSDMDGFLADVEDLVEVVDRYHGDVLACYYVRNKNYLA